MRLVLTFSGVFVIAALVPPLPHCQGPPWGVPRAPNEQMSTRAALCSTPPDGAERIAVLPDPPRVSSALAAGDRSILIPPAPRASPTTPKLNRPTPAAFPDLDLTALGLVDPRKPNSGGVPKGGLKAVAAAPKSATPAPATILSDLRARLPAPAGAPQLARSPTAKIPELNLAALGLSDPRKPTGGTQSEDRGPMNSGAGPRPRPEPSPAPRPQVALPPWWRELDTDGDGQIGLYEWRQGGRPTADFVQLDLNADGLLTADEYRRATRPVRVPKVP